MYWKTSFCCLNDVDVNDVLMMLWVLCPDEEDERREVTEGGMKGIYSCSEEMLEVLLSP